MIRMWFGLLGVLALGACTSVAKETSLSTGVRASEYNDVFSEYYERPTYSKLWSLSDGATVLRVVMDEYGSNLSQSLAPKYSISFDSRFIDAYLPLIDKYIEWTKLASTRGEMIEKEIGFAPTWANIGKGRLKFEIFSGNSADHYLVIGFCSTICLDEKMMFNLSNSNKLKGTLLELKGGQINHTDTDAIYK